MMKNKLILLLAASLLILACNEPTQMKENERVFPLVETQQNEDVENQDYQKEMEEFKKIAEDKITANEKSISDFNARIAAQKSEAKAEYQAKLDDLNNQNTDLKKRISDFNTESVSKWEKFKTEFTNDMDTLGKALKAFTTHEEK